MNKFHTSTYADSTLKKKCPCYISILGRTLDTRKSHGIRREVASCSQIKYIFQLCHPWWQIGNGPRNCVKSIVVVSKVARGIRVSGNLLLSTDNDVEKSSHSSISTRDHLRYFASSFWDGCHRFLFCRHGKRHRPVSADRPLQVLHCSWTAWYFL